MTDIQALRALEHGRRAECVSMTLPDLSSGQVRVRIHYSCLNYKDALAVTGTGKIMRKLPCTAGIDFAGIVEASESELWKAGDRVLVTGCNIGEKFDGGLAEAAQVDGDILVPVPDDIPLAESMIYGTAGFTAALAVYRMLENHQAPGDGPIAVNGATGGVGSIAIALFAGLGFPVTAVTGKLDRRDYLMDLGASDLIETSSLGPPETPLMKARWGGAVDNLGGAVLSHMLATTKPFGNVASIGLAASHELNSSVMPMILRGVSLLGINSVETPWPMRLAVWEHLFGDWRIANCARLKAGEITLAEVPDACDTLIQGRVTGRYLVRLPGAS